MRKGIPVRRRTAKRYGKSGSVALRRVVSAPLLTGSLFDLSTGGCLIWLDCECAFEAAELIEVKLQTDDVTFRVMGSVRHSGEDDRLIGVEFLDLPVKEKQELDRFVARLQASADAENALAAF